MQAIQFTPATELDRHQVLANALVALATGALLGVLAIMPYDRLLGLSVEACFALRSVVAVGLLARLRVIQESVVSTATGTHSLHAVFFGYLERVRHAFKTVRSTGSREALLVTSGR
jgi:hypothetical protein